MPPMYCRSILKYTQCGHEKNFHRPCRENFGSDGRKCSYANMHTTRQTLDKWPCQLCRIFRKIRRQIKRDSAGNDSANVTTNAMGTLQGDINKDLQVKSVDEPTRQSECAAIRRYFKHHPRPVPAREQRIQPIEKLWPDCHAKDDTNKDLQVKDVDEPTLQDRSGPILAAKLELVVPKPKSP
ncbi:hypothetical protein E4U58_002552 [Claviceps cyperi]|nr:hypothetical protein E4U58_002552 [Claviceps cyperi]